MKLKHHSKFLFQRILSFEYNGYNISIGISPLRGMKTGHYGSNHPNFLDGQCWNRKLNIFWICKYRI